MIVYLTIVTLLLILSAYINVKLFIKKRPPANIKAKERKANIKTLEKKLNVLKNKKITANTATDILDSLRKQ